MNEISLENEIRAGLVDFYMEKWTNRNSNGRVLLKQREGSSEPDLYVIYDEADMRASDNDKATGEFWNVREERPAAEDAVSEDEVHCDDLDRAVDECMEN